MKSPTPPPRALRGASWLWLSAALVACGQPGGGDAPCPEGTVRAGADECVDPGALDAGPDLGEDGDDGGMIADAETDAGASGDLPFVVDSVFAASGFMGDGEAGGIEATEVCPMRGGEGRGLCHRFVHTQGEAGWAGVWWQSPGGNWGEMPGHPVPAGATRLQFAAWGAAGGETITFAVGYGPADGFGVEQTVALTDSPTIYTIDLAGVPYADIAGGFSWVNQGEGGGVEFFVDDIVFAADPADAVDPCTVRCAMVRGLGECAGVPGHGACKQRCAERRAGACSAEADTWLGCVGDGGWACEADMPVSANGCAVERQALLDCEGAGGPATLPFYIDDHFFMTGYMGGGEIEVGDCPMGMDGGTCRRITWTPGGEPWIGFFFQHPAENWGDLPGLAVAPGATHVRFRAWGEAGGERANFAVGISDVDGFSNESGYMALGTEPMDLWLPVPGDVEELTGGFAWFLENPAGAETVTFYLDDVQWRDDAVPGAVEGGGCTDPEADNHDPEAAEDDGSCVYPVAFQVDMSCHDQPFGEVLISGPFCEWCAEGFPLADDDGDGVWTATYAFPVGPLEYKYILDGFAAQEDLIDDVAAGGQCAPITDGVGFANRQIIIEGPRTQSDTYGQCTACGEEPVDPPDRDRPFEAVTFDDPEVEYGLRGFGGAEDSSVVVDPTNPDNMVGRVLKSGAAELWAGTTLWTGPNETVGIIPIDADNTRMTVRVWSPVAGIQVRLKIEDSADAAISVETEATVTAEGMWEELTFDFANQAPGTAALNVDAIYDRASIFFDFGVPGAEAGERVYFFDDVAFGGEGGPIDPPDPDPIFETVTFDDPDIEYGLRGFGGAEDASVVVDPTNPDNMVGRVLKSGAAELWAGTTLWTGPNETVGVIPIDADNTRMTVRVWSPVAGIQVRLKIEDSTDAAISVETEATVTAEGMWEELTFDFANQAPGTAALNVDAIYDRASIFFDFGVPGAEAGERVYFFDDVAFGGEGGPVDPPEPAADFPITFDDPTVDYALIGFGGAEEATIEVDPAGGMNRVARVVKSAAAELWAGTTIATGLQQSVPVIGLDPAAPRMTVRVWSPVADIPVRLKIEDAGDPTVSVETEARATVVDGWELLTFDFSVEAPGTAPFNPDAVYDKVSIFFDFGVPGVEAGERVYVFDDVDVP